MDRRAFAQTLVVLPIGAFLVRCSSNVSDHTSLGPEVVGDTIVYTSTTVEDHNHTFTIDRAAFSDPPSNGVSDETSFNVGHVHTVSVSSDQLASLNSGETMDITSSESLGHRHTFQFTRV